MGEEPKSGIKSGPLLTERVKMVGLLDLMEKKTAKIKNMWLSALKS